MTSWQGLLIQFIFILVYWWNCVTKLIGEVGKNKNVTSVAYLLRYGEVMPCLLLISSCNVHTELAAIFHCSTVSPFCSLQISVAHDRFRTSVLSLEVRELAFSPNWVIFDDLRPEYPTNSRVVPVPDYPISRSQHFICVLVNVCPPLSPVLVG